MFFYAVVDEACLYRWSQLQHVSWYTAFRREHNPVLEMGHLSLVLLRSLGVWDRALSVQDLWAMRTGMHFTFFRFRPLPFPSLEHPDYILTITVSTPLSVRGITCKLCIPDEKAFKVCDKASEQVEVDCDVQPPPENLTQLWENRTYDACYTAQIEALALGKTFKTFVFGCGVKVNQSDNL